MTSEDEDLYSILGAHPSDSQAELKQKYQKLALLVQAHPVLWNKSYDGYGDRHLQDRAWKIICEALRPDWDGLTQSQQAVIEEDLRKKWKSMRDLFLTEQCRAEMNGSSTTWEPFYDELLFLLPSSRSEGSCGKRESLAESPTTHRRQQRERKTTPMPSAEVNKEGDQEDQTELLNVDIMPTQAARPKPTARTAYNRKRGRRSLQAAGMELENEALSFTQRVRSNDKCHLFGLEMASCCRRMPPEVRASFMSYIEAAADAFDSADSLPEVGVLINGLQSFHGLRDAPEVVSTSSQTNPVWFSAPSPAPPTTDS